MENRKFIIKNSGYVNGVFPKVPVATSGKYTLLYATRTGNIILVDNRTTPREVSTSKVDRIIEISASQIIEKVKIESPSNFGNYKFDITISLYLEVTDPIEYFNSQSDNLEQSLVSILDPVVRRVTKTYDVIEYDNMEEEILDKIRANGLGEELTGLHFRVFDVSATPNREAMQYVERKAKADLERRTKIAEDISITEIAKHQGSKANELELSLENAIKQEVVKGNISIEEALERLKQTEQRDGEQRVQNVQSVLDLISKMNFSDSEIETLQKGVLKNIKLISDTAPALENPETDDYFPTEDDIVDADVDADTDEE